VQLTRTSVRQSAPASTGVSVCVQVDRVLLAGIERWSPRHNPPMDLRPPTPLSTPSRQASLGQRCVECVDCVQRDAVGVMCQAEATVRVGVWACVCVCV
jgi:hypothetical protein